MVDRKIASWKIKGNDGIRKGKKKEEEIDASTHETDARSTRNRAGPSQRNTQ